MIKRTILAAAMAAALATPAVAQDAARSALDRIKDTSAVVPVPQAQLNRAEANTIFKKADMAGQWHMTVWLEGGISEFWVACKAVITSTGKIKPGGKCLFWDPFDSELIKTSLGGGRLILAKNGKITGTVILGSLPLSFSDAWMEPTKTFFQGVGVDSDLPHGISAVKR